jgi:hypothetical protein
MAPSKKQQESPSPNEARNDLLLVTGSLPRSISEASSERERFLRVQEAYRLTDLILSSASKKSKAVDKAEDNESKSAFFVKRILFAEIFPLVYSALKTGFITIVRAGTAMISTVLRVASMVVLKVATFAISAITTAVSSIVAFLVANPIVAIGLGVLALGYVGYKFFFGDKEKSEPKVTKAIPKTEAAAPSSSPAAAATPQSSTAPAPAEPTKGPATAAKAKMSQTKVANDVAGALKIASEKVDVPLNLLTAMAGVESAFRADAAAGTSSAKGLFQFITGTWATMLKRYGAKYGVPSDADRMNPTYSAIMAAAMMKHEGYPAAAKATGGSVSITDIYLTHFMGAAGGASFLRAYMKTPGEAATNSTPGAVVKANMNIFYDKAGKPRTFKEIYDQFANKLAGYEAKTASIQGTDTPVVAKAPETPKEQVKVASNSQPGGSSGKVESYDYIPATKNRPSMKVSTT